MRTIRPCGAVAVIYDLGASCAYDMKTVNDWHRKFVVAPTRPSCMDSNNNIDFSADSIPGKKLSRS
jgi:hypothetical protein